MSIQGIRKNKFYLMLIFLIILGVVIMIYPHYQQTRYVQKSLQTIEKFDERRKEDGGQAYKDLYAEMLKYNEKLFATKQDKLTNATAYEQVDFSLMERGLQDEMLGYITIPKMNIELPIYVGATLANMRRGAVRLSQTSLPVGGSNTNTVIAGHRAMPTAAMFRDIQKLALGDVIYVTSLTGTMEYKVSGTQIISPNNLNAVLIQEGRDMITLVTCHPYATNLQRYVVYAERVV